MYVRSFRESRKRRPKHSEVRLFGQYTDHIHPSVWALLSAHVSRWACVVAGSVPSVPKKEEAVAGGHDEGQVRGCNLSVILPRSTFTKYHLLDSQYP